MATSGPKLPAQLSVLLLDEQELSDLLQSVVEAAAATLAPGSEASISLLSGWERAAETSNASSLLARQVDEVQYHSGEGPCVEAMLTGSEVTGRFPSARWPELSAAAARAPFRAVWSIPIQVREQTTGSLNIYSSAADPWEASSAAVPRVLARQAGALLCNAVALAQSEHLNDTLRQALETRTVIGQAQGVLMGRQAINADQAFDILRRASQRTNRKLRVVAAEIVAGVIQQGSKA